MANLAELREDLQRLSHELHEVMVEAGPTIDLDKVHRLSGSTADKQAWIKQRHDVLSDLGAQIDGLENLEKIGTINESVWQKQTKPVGGYPMPGANGNGQSEGARLLQQKGLRQIIVEHPGYKELIAGTRSSISIELPVLDFKALVTLANISPQPDRLALVNMATEERTVADLPLQGTTERTGLEYYEETTLTNAAAPVAEGAVKPESALGWTLRAEPVRKIATWIPATDEVLADNAFLESQIRGRLTYMVTRTEEAQILQGTGTAPALLGFLNRPGLQTVAKGGTEANADAIYRAMQAVRGAAGTQGVGFAEPTGVVLNPNNWTAIQLLKTADGLYIWGHPSEMGPERIWGKMVRQTTAMPAGTALIGAFRPHSEVVRRTGITVTLSTEHATNFTENKVTILAEERLALCVYRPSAFCTATALS
jgi:Phage capsid family